MFYFDVLDYFQCSHIERLSCRRFIFVMYFNCHSSEIDTEKQFLKRVLKKFLTVVLFSNQKCQKAQLIRKMSRYRIYVFHNFCLGTISIDGWICISSSLVGLYLVCNCKCWASWIAQSDWLAWSTCKYNIATIQWWSWCKWSDCKFNGRTTLNW